ncbi:MAG: zinc-ribbon domain-containing protein [Bacteroidales bacterium]|nr:zinc-ribbon domain-containing protein [Bacteroidales bacterium]
MSLIYCKECGAKISNKAPVCPKCGAPQSIKEAILEDNPVLELESSNTSKKSNIWIKWFIVGVIAGLLIIVGIVYYSKLFQQNNEDEMLLAEWNLELADDVNANNISTEAISVPVTTQGLGNNNYNNNCMNGHDYVDLGLSVKWATCNVGASTPEGFGNFYAWGEVNTKWEYTKENSETWDIEVGNISGEKTYDVARLCLGEGWRIPTEYEARELIDKCTWISTNMNGIKGSKVIGPNGNSIFLPAAGYYYGNSHDSVTYNGRYWTSSPYNNRPNCAYYMYFSNDRHYVNWYRRFQGHPIRPVLD